jgi:hypothetical protein
MQKIAVMMIQMRLWYGDKPPERSEMREMEDETTQCESTSWVI